jgi:hypothetical protein
MQPQDTAGGSSEPRVEREALFGSRRHHIVESGVAQVQQQDPSSGTSALGTRSARARPSASQRESSLAVDGDAGRQAQSEGSSAGSRISTRASSSSTATS